MLPRNHISGYRIQFLHHGKLHDFTICKVDRDEAETKTRQVEYLIVRLKQRLIVLPEPEQSRQDTGPTCARENERKLFQSRRLWEAVAQPTMPEA